MSLLMDALKKADAAKQDKSASDESLFFNKDNEDNNAVNSSEEATTLRFVELEDEEIIDNTQPTHFNNEETHHIHWEEDILPEFQEDAKDIVVPDTIEPVEQKLEKQTESPIDWEENLLPEFQNDLKDEVEDKQPVEKKEKNVTSFSFVPQEKTIAAEETEQSITFQSQSDIHSTAQPDIIDELSPPFENNHTHQSQKTIDKSPLEWHPGIFGEVTLLEQKTFAEPQPETAQRILSAKSQPPAKFSNTFYFAITLSVLLIGVGIYYLYDILNGLKDGQMIATQKVWQTRIEKNNVQPSNDTTSTVMTPQPELVASETVDVEIAAPQPNTIKAQIEEEMSLKIAALIPTVPLETTPISPKPEKSIAMIPKRTVVIPKEVAPPKKPTPEKLQLKPAKSQETKKTEAKGIYTLKKNTKPRRIDSNLTQAYQAFQRGEDRLAYQQYTKVLQREPKNRDALLGMAAIAARQNQQRKAENYYKKVLQLYPQDTLAQTGLLNILTEREPTQNVSQLKLLLEKSPKSAYIHFNLGNVYARQSQWEKAQQAYFNAYRYDKTQPDYTYNLAVSLEHLNQTRVALQYYKKTLQLIQKHPNTLYNLDLQQLQQREKILSKYVKPTLNVINP